MANWWDKNLTDKQKFRLQEPQDASLLDVVSAVPTPVGDVASGLLAAQDVSKGNYGMAALNSLGLLPFIPAMGGIVTKATKKLPEPIIDDDLLKIIMNDKANANSNIRYAIDTDVIGVIPNQIRNFDRALLKNNFSIDDLMAAFKNTRNELKSKYGNEIILHRAEAPKAEWNPDTQTVYMATKDEASKYINGDNANRVLTPYQLNIDDILGANAEPSGYYEFIVRKPK